MHKSITWCAVVAAAAACASQAAAQDTKPTDTKPADIKQADAKVPLKKLGTPEAKTTEAIGAVSSLRALSDGSLFVNDFQQRHIVMLDGSLKQVKIIADTLTAPIPYGQRQTSVISYTGDSTIIVDPATLSLVILNKRGEVGRVMSMPRPQDFNAIVSANLGANAFDSKGRLIYRAQAGQGGGGGLPFGGGAGGRGGAGGNTGGRQGAGAGGAQGRGAAGGAGAAAGRGGLVAAMTSAVAAVDAQPVCKAPTVLADPADGGTRMRTRIRFPFCARISTRAKPIRSHL